MAASIHTSLGGIVFVAAGLMFFAAAAIGRQLAFAGCGAMFVAIGVAWLLRAKTKKQERAPTE
ncbi:MULTISPECIES: hypothetical protein [Xanthomonas translucens group]|uniref:Uncharacterized protein n=1 Tax=Xanthomonas cerealis pv. cerealis TaxID=152263 RepID=A0A514EB21_9XANT|nr:hypothetical protein [Xanthomonas translucens]QDI03251.1 hypothetical protein E4A48_05670 [Xanthomonas translucens pv. cerealis]UKE45786.1 hypothetical protein KHA79_11375 [Xanthomonas translucens pv. cerealis]UKE71099.1 hypothetical protein K8O61_08880 [Xanthomonas translucens pv. pistacia]